MTKMIYLLSLTDTNLAEIVMDLLEIFYRTKNSLFHLFYLMETKTQWRYTDLSFCSYELDRNHLR